jgi:hypothetical protein
VEFLPIFCLKETGHGPGIAVNEEFLESSLVNCLLPFNVVLQASSQQI